MTPPLRLAILGAGRRGMLVARVMMDLPGVDVVMLCDPNRHRLRLVQESYPHIQCTTTFQDVVENDWVDAAVVAVPLVKNSRVALALLNAG
ncbi:MAG: Gfo/Idh/MocA family oxidoreductase, partial [Magnetococcales bacterium]|nr:Gfo/Idh/MocA family oxidoreductase [Magnetococcales bacterium]